MTDLPCKSEQPFARPRHGHPKPSAQRLAPSDGTKIRAQRRGTDRISFCRAGSRDSHDLAIEEGAG
jgi:hypothetical protein